MRNIEKKLFASLNRPNKLFANVKGYKKIVCREVRKDIKKISLLKLKF